MRVALVAESFLPHMNGVTHSLLQVIDHLSARGDEAVVLAPSAAELPAQHRHVPIEPITSLALPLYRSVRVAVSGERALQRRLAAFAPDIVHLASPFALGWSAVRAAESLGLPTVAVYQTDVPAFAARYGFPAAESMLWGHLRRIHQRATLTLAPSTSAMMQLADHGVDRVRLWRRGVDSVRFSPLRRSEAWRRSVAPGGERIIGFVGRLATEKQIEDLRVLAGLANTRLVIIGDGPLRARLELILPSALFTGFLHGEALARAMASIDVFVHPGESETFCQTIQEAMASGVPVVATGRGGPIDLVDSSRTGWLYSPGNLFELRDRVADLVGDDAKRHAFGVAARSSVLTSTWPAVCAQLIDHYQSAMTAAAPTPT